MKTVDIHGEERFAGYISGRIGVENFRAGDDKNILGITAFDGRGVDFLHASAPVGSCLQYRYTTMDFRDVSAKSSWYEAVSQIYSLGQMRLDENFNFAPRDVLTWDSVLEMAFAVQCAEPDDFDLLRSFDLPSLKNYPLQNTLKSRRVYTAFDTGWLTSDVDIMQAPTREQVLRLWMKAFAVPVNKLATNTSFEDIESTDSLAPLLVAARKYDLIPATKRFRSESVMSRAEGAQWFVSFFNAEQEGRIDRSEEMDQFDELRGGTGREVTEEEQVRVALIQKEIAEERNERIAQIVPLPEDLDTTGKAAFIRRQGESEEDFLKRLEAAKQGLPEIVLPDYEELAEQSLIARGVVPREVSESMIQIEDRADFIRRQDEDREEFLQRLAAAKRELEQKKIALQPAVELTTMKTSAPLQNEVQLQITQETDMSCRVKEEGETDAMFEARCLGVENKVEKTIYDKILEFFRKTPSQQEMEECEEVTISAPPEEPEMPQLDKTRLDVIFRIVTPEEEARNSTTKTKDK